MTKQSFIVELEQLTDARDYAGVDALAARHLESVLPLCDEEESWQIDTLLHHAAMLSAAHSTKPAALQEQAPQLVGAGRRNGRESAARKDDSVPQPGGLDTGMAR